MNNDNVNHPSHYTSGPFECIELTARYPFLGGNAIKYVYRWQDKNGLEDLRKALWYLNRAKAESPYEPIGLYPLDSLVPPYGCFHVDDESVHMLRKLARLNWQNMRGFWKGHGRTRLRPQVRLHPRQEDIGASNPTVGVHADRRRANYSVRYLAG